MTTATANKRSIKPYRLRRTDIPQYLDDLRKSGRAEATISKYKSLLESFELFIGESRQIKPESLAQWQQSREESGYSAQSINTGLSAVNGLLNHVGRRELQYLKRMTLEADQPETLSRAEYLMLLDEARRIENVQLYLLIKTLACIELGPGDLAILDRQAVNSGIVKGKVRGSLRELSIPESLRGELLDFAIHREIRSGPLFLNRQGRAMNRTVISRMIAELGASIGLPPGKANPRKLHQLYLDTQNKLRKQAEEWVETSYRALLESENEEHSWRKANCPQN